MSAFSTRNSINPVRNHLRIFGVVSFLLVVCLLSVTLRQVPARADFSPIADDQTVTTDEDTAVDITLTASDADNDPLTFSIVTDPAHGLLSGTPPNVTYTPATNYNGGDSFTFRANDGTTDSNVATVTITVDPVNDAPTLAPLPDRDLNEDAVLDNAIDLWNYASDVETADSGLVYTIDNSPDPNAGVTIDGNRYVDIQPAANWFGFTDVRIKVTDPGGLSTTDTFQVTVNSVNDAPWIDPAVPNRSANEDVAITIDLTSYEHDVESSGTALDWTVSGENNCTVSGENSDDDVLTFTPQANYAGADIVLLTLTDADGGTATQSIILTWNPVNDAPTLAPLPDQNLDEDAVLDNAIDLWNYASDVETADSGLVYTIDNSPDPNAGVTIDGNRYVDIRPAANWYGATDVRIKVADPEGASTTDTFRVVVRSVNDPPVANDQAVSTNEDTPKAITLAASDAEGNTLTYTIVAGPAHGTLSGTPPNMTYTPATNYNGGDSFTFRANDGTSDSNVATVTITVNPVNDPPVANGQTVSTNEDTPKAITLAASDVDGDPLTYNIISGPAHGTLSGTPPNLTYSPAANYYGPDSFSFQAKDNVLNSNIAVVSITINPVNDPPLATDNGYLVQEDSTGNLLYPLVDDSDVEGDSLTIAGATQPISGTVAIAQGGAALVYTPDPDFYGYDRLTYTISDGNGGTDTATINIQVVNVNDDPVAENDLIQILEDSGANALPVLANDTYLPDPVETLSIASATPAAHGQLAIAPDGSYLTYTPSPNYYGPDALTYTVIDHHGGSTQAEVTITVLNVNDNPLVVTDVVTISEDSINANIYVLQNDTYLPDPPETLTIIHKTNGSHGSVTIASGTRLRYTPVANYYGQDQLTYTISDGHGGTATGIVQITVQNINDNPLARRDTAALDEDSGPNQIDVLSNDTYLPDPPETLAIIGYTSAQHGTVTITNGGANLTYRPEADYNGTDSFAYTISDGNGGYHTASVDLTVRGINDRPNAENDSASTREDTPVTIDVLKNDTDIDGHLVASSVRVVSGPSHGSTAVDSGNGSVTYTPRSNWNGSDGFTYEVCDDGSPLPSRCSTASVAISVGTVNDPPISDAGPDQDVATNALVTLDGSNSRDPDGNLPLIYYWWQTGGPPVFLSDASAPKPTFTAPGDPANLTFALRVTDALGQADLVPDETVVTVLNQAPVANAGPDQSVQVKSRVTLNGSGSSDPDDDLPLTYLWVQSGGPPVLLSDATVAKPSFIAPDERTTLTFSLFVSDAFGEPAPTRDEVVVRVNKPYVLFMPAIAHRYVAAPDLVIRSITARSNSVELVIANQGNGPANHEFWVDVYIDPRATPTAVNQPWYQLADEGLVWGVFGQGLSALGPGGTLTLTTGDAYYYGDYSKITWPLPAGTPIYGQVDSFDPSTTYGTVLELDEILGRPYNNIYGPIPSAAGAAAGTTSSDTGAGPPALGNLPPRY